MTPWFVHHRHAEIGIGGVAPFGEPAARYWQISGRRGEHYLAPPSLLHPAFTTRERLWFLLRDGMSVQAEAHPLSTIP
jgi:hypothetical protein